MPAAAQQLDPNGYSAIVLEAGADNYPEFASTLVSEFERRGFLVRPSLAAVPAEHAGRIAIAGYQWNSDAFLGVDLKLYDAFTGDVIASYQTNTLIGISTRTALKRVAKQAVRQMGFTGFSQTAYADNLELRNQLSSDVESVPISVRELYDYLDDNLAQLDPLEGVWSSVNKTDPNYYKIGIVRDREAIGSDFTAFVLESNVPWWRPGQVKAKFSSTASETLYSAAYRMGDRAERRITMSLEQATLLTATVDELDLSFIKNYPTASAARPARPALSSKSGTGFVIGRRLVATNYHVIDGATEVQFRTADGDLLPLTVVRVDKINDLATLEIASQGAHETSLKALPLSKTRTMAAEDAYTIGFPLSGILGENVRVTEGAVSATEGIDSDPRFYQVSIPTQPGNSGGPVLNSRGEVIGILTGQLNTAYALKSAGVVPQNVNFAIKLHYVLPLIPDSMLAGPEDTVEMSAGLTRARQVERLRASVGRIIAR